jgi:hypothetical protein
VSGVAIRVASCIREYLHAGFWRFPHNPSLRCNFPALVYLQIPGLFNFSRAEAFPANGASIKLSLTCSHSCDYEHDFLGSIFLEMLFPSAALHVRSQSHAELSLGIRYKE